MKKYFIIIMLTLVSVFSITILAKNRVQAMESKLNAKEELNSLYENYGDVLLKSFFSLEELRPFSIIQFDKLSDNYDNKWISPEKIVAGLKDEEKTMLLDKIITLIESDENPANSTKTLDKIKSWCLAEVQFGFLTDKIGINQASVIKAIRNINTVRQITDTGAPVKGNKQSDLDDKMFFGAINYISSLSFDQQLKYYSDVYNQLSDICKK